MIEKESKRERDGGGGSMSLSTIKTVNKSCKTTALIVTAWTRAIVSEEGEGTECHCPLSKP